MPRTASEANARRHEIGLGPVRIAESVLARPENAWLQRHSTGGLLTQHESPQAPAGQTIGDQARRRRPSRREQQDSHHPVLQPLEGQTMGDRPRRRRRRAGALNPLDDPTLTLAPGPSALPPNPSQLLPAAEQLGGFTDPVPPPSAPSTGAGDSMTSPACPSGTQLEGIEGADMDCSLDFAFPMEDIDMEHYPAQESALELDISAEELRRSTSALSGPRRSTRLATHLESVSQTRWPEGSQQTHQLLDEEEDPDIDPGRSGTASWNDLLIEDLNLGEEDFQSYPVAQPGQEGISLWELQAEGFMQRLAEIDGQLLDASDITLLKAYALKVNQGLTNETYDMMRGLFEEGVVPSLKTTEARVQALSGFQPVRYDCCRNSCVCYVGPYKELQECPKCHLARLRPDGRPFAYFEYLPLIPCLTALASNSVYAEKMRYRSQHTHNPQVYKDVFDGSHYQSLLHTFVNIEGHQLPHYFFSDPRDIALGLSADGFGPFKQRTKTAWPLILFNYNLSPEERFHKDNVISLGTIPGPNKPAAMDSFLWPFIQEMVQLAIGVAAFDAISKHMFMLRAFLLLVFGDIPAVSMLIHMKGHNGCSPCRMCEIKGISVPGSTANTHYVPLDRSQFPDRPEPARYEPTALPLRTHERFLQQAKEVNFALTKTKSEELAKEYGIKGVPLLSTLTSLAFPTSFPYDFMHLIWHNLLENLVRLWTGKFKNLNHESEPYFLAPSVWEAIGEATAQAGDTIPSAYGSRVPDVASEKSNMTAESWSVWTFYIAPTLLHGRFKSREVYDHFVELVRLLLLCLEYEITMEQVDALECGFTEWVLKYERMYYKFDPLCLSCCPVTVHALLHIAPSIRAMGPAWAYWAFPMERYCSDVLRNIRSRRYPYISINRYVTSRAQLTQIKNLYNLHSTLDLRRKRQNLHERTYPDYPDFILSDKKETVKIVDLKLWLPLRATLGTHFRTNADTFRRAIPRDISFIQYGRLRRTGCGNTIHASELMPSLTDSRDMTFVRYHLLVDKHARCRNRAPEYEEQVHFGQLLRILAIPVPAIPQASVPECTVLYAIIKPVHVLHELDSVSSIPVYRFYDQTIRLIHLDQVKSVVGRIPIDGGWAIIDRSTSLSSSIVTTDIASETT